MNSKAGLLPAALALGILAACGGGDAEDAVPPGTPQDTAYSGSARTELPSSLSLAEYNQLRDAIDYDEVLAVPFSVSIRASVANTTRLKMLPMN